MFNTAHYERKANLNYNEISPHTSKNGHHQKVYKLNAGEGVEKRNALALLVGIYIDTATMEDNMKNP